MLKIRKLLFIFLTLISTSDLRAAEAYEIWWEQCLDDKVSYGTFSEWLGNVNAPSRMAMRQHVKMMGYQSILDVPAGICLDYFGFQNDQMTIAYQGVDITPKLVKLGKEKQIPIIEGDIKSLPFPDSSFDISYARHILEHLDSYEKAVQELIRVARNETMVVFFMKPQAETKIHSNYDRNYLLYHNIYCKPELEQFILLNPKVLRVEWEEVSDKEIILHIYLNYGYY